MMEEKVRIRAYKGYRIFYNPEQEQYFLAIHQESNNDMYFRISEEEYQMMDSDVEHLDRIAYGCSIFGTSSPRYLSSEFVEAGK